MSGKEKDMLEKEAKEKVAKRSTCLEKVRQIQTTNTNTNTIDDINENTIYYLFTRPKNCAHSWSCEFKKAAKETSPSIFYFYKQTIYCSICGPLYSIFNHMIYSV